MRFFDIDKCAYLDVFALRLMATLDESSSVCHRVVYLISKVAILNRRRFVQNFYILKGK